METFSLTEKELNNIIEKAIQKDRETRGDSTPTNLNIKHSIDTGSLITSLIWKNAFDIAFK